MSPDSTFPYREQLNCVGGSWGRDGYVIPTTTSVPSPLAAYI